MNRVLHLLLIVSLNGALAQADPGRVSDAARADAFRQLFDQLVTTRGHNATSIRDLLDGDEAGEFHLRRVALSVCTFSKGRVDARSRSRMTVHLELDALRTALLKEATCAHMAELVWALGEGSLASVGVAAAEDDGRKTPPGWENTTTTGLRLAEQGARLAAIDALARYLGDLLGSEVARQISPRIASAAEFDRPEYDPCQVCRVKARIRVRDALRAGHIKYDGPSSIGDKVIEVRGHGTAPIAHTHRPPSHPAPTEQPAWSARRLLATGRGADADAATARRAARVDAVVQLAREIDALQLPRPISQDMRSFILQRPDCDDVWAAYLDSVRTTAVDCDGTECRVTVEADLAWLWRLVVENLD